MRYRFVAKKPSKNAELDGARCRWRCGAGDPVGVGETVLQEAIGMT